MTMQRGFVSASFHQTAQGQRAGIRLPEGGHFLLQKTMKLWDVHVSEDCTLYITPLGAGTPAQTITGPVSDGNYTITFPEPSDAVAFDMEATGLGDGRQITFEYALY